LAKKFETNLVLIMNDYFRCAKNTGSLNSNRKSPTVNLFANRSEISFKWSKPHDVLVV